MSGYTDCGPHASCRCGLCVAGGDKNLCLVPECSECSPQIINQLYAITAVLLLIIAQLSYAILRVLYTIAMVRPGTNREFLCLGKCCLCNMELYSPAIGGVANPKRQHKVIRILTKYWPVLRLPPMLLFFLTFLCLVFYIQIIMMYFDKAVNDIHAVIPEEYFPSDHLMLVMEFKTR